MKTLVEMLFVDDTRDQSACWPQVASIYGIELVKLRGTMGQESAVCQLEAAVGVWLLPGRYCS